MKNMYLICHDDLCREEDAQPIIAIFTVGDDVETQDVIESFGVTLHGFVPGFEDCTAIRFAGDSVCKEYGATVVYVEADQSFGKPRTRGCDQCGWIPVDDAIEGLYVINMDFCDETWLCGRCLDSTAQTYGRTICENCGTSFTYSHLLPNKDDPERNREICPYCGEIWCE